MLHSTPPVLQVATSQAPAQCSALLPLLEKAICQSWLTAASMPPLTLTTLDHQAPVQCTTPPLLAITKYCQEFKSTSQLQNIRNDQATFNKFTNHIVTTTRKHPVQ